MRAMFLCLVCAIGAPSALVAQAPDTSWTETFGGSSVDRLYDMIQTSDDGYALVGFTSSYGAGGEDVWVVKTDASGGFEWYSTFGGSSDDRGYSVIETSDGGYMIAAFTQSSGAGGYDYWLIKTDASGDLEWEDTYGGPEDDVPWAVVETTDNGFAVCGVTQSYGEGDHDIWFIKTDAYGSVQWTETYGGTGDDRGRDVCTTSDGGYGLTGCMSSGSGDFDVWLAKTDSAGNINWESSSGGSGSDIGRAVIQTSDGGFIVSGDTDSYGSGSTDAWLLKASSTCVIEWDETFGGSNTDYGLDVQVDTDGGYLVAGYTDSFGAGSNDAWLLKTDPSGALLWNFTLGTAGNDIARAVQVTSDDAYAIGAYTDSFGAGSNDFWLIKTESATGIADANLTGPWTAELSVAPNPFTDYAAVSFQLPEVAHVRLGIYDISGKLVVSPINQIYEAGSHAVTINDSSLVPGVYILKLSTSSNHQTTQRVVVL